MNVKTAKRYLKALAEVTKTNGRLQLSAAAYGAIPSAINVLASEPLDETTAHKVVAALATLTSYGYIPSIEHPVQEGQIRQLYSQIDKEKQTEELLSQLSALDAQLIVPQASRKRKADEKVNEEVNHNSSDLPVAPSSEVSDAEENKEPAGKKPRRNLKVLFGEDLEKVAPIVPEYLLGPGASKVADYFISKGQENRRFLANVQATRVRLFDPANNNSQLNPAKMLVDAMQKFVTDLPADRLTPELCDKLLEVIAYQISHIPRPHVRVEGEPLPPPPEPVFPASRKLQALIREAFNEKGWGQIALAHGKELGFLRSVGVNLMDKAAQNPEEPLNVGAVLVDAMKRHVSAINYIFGPKANAILCELIYNIGMSMAYTRERGNVVNVSPVRGNNYFANIFLAQAEILNHPFAIEWMTSVRKMLEANQTRVQP